MPALMHPPVQFSVAGKLNTAQANHPFIGNKKSAESEIAKNQAENNGMRHEKENHGLFRPDLPRSRSRRKRVQHRA